MKLAILILKEEELLDKLIKELNENNFHNLTTINSESVATSGNNKSVRVFSSLRYIMNYFYDDSRVMLIPIEEDKIDDLFKVTSNILTKDKYMFLIFEAVNCNVTYQLIIIYILICCNHFCPLFYQIICTYRIYRVNITWYNIYVSSLF